MPLTKWISEGITVAITEAEVIADLDSGFVPGSDPRSPDARR